MKNSTYSNIRIDHDTTKAILFLASVIGCLLFLHVLGHVSKFYLGYGDHIIVKNFIRYFDLDKERNIPTYFSTVMLLLCSATLLLIAGIEKKIAGRFVMYWLGLAIIFLFLSIDENLSIHERFIDPVHDALGELPGFFLFAWVIPYGLLVLVFSLLYLKFTMQLPSKIRILVVAGGVIYVAGAIGVEMIGGFYWEANPIHSNTVDGTYEIIIITIEEALEMFGVLIFLKALLDYIHLEWKEVTVRFLVPTHAERELKKPSIQSSLFQDQIT